MVNLPAQLYSSQEVIAFQDRVRAGVISAKYPILDVIVEAADRGRPVLGICNGCQVLAETGLVPNLNGKKQLYCSLSKNVKKNKPIGFICDWVYVRIKLSRNSLFTSQYSDNMVIPIPINHGEGRFILGFKEKSLLSEHTLIQYCDSEGNLLDTETVNPNGSSFNIAGLTNKEGNVMALMPHPERATFLKQIPTWLDNEWGLRKSVMKEEGVSASGPWTPFFMGLKKYLMSQHACVEESRG